MNNLSNIKKYFQPHRILDIGGRVGEFYHHCHAAYPDSYYFIIEGNVNCEGHIKSNNVDYSIEMLSDSIREVEFYINKDDTLSSGCSYYRECNTGYFEKDNIIVEKRMTNTLDNMFTEDSTFDLIKIDTQGSELDIIKGGLNLCGKTSGLLLECSLEICNENAPLYDDIKLYLSGIGFYEGEILDNHYYQGRLVQVDSLFIRK